MDARGVKIVVDVSAEKKCFFFFFFFASSAFSPIGALLLDTLPSSVMVTQDILLFPRFTDV